MKLTPQENFWQWFVHHETELFNFDATDEVGRERLFKELAKQMRKINPDLVFEFGPKGAKREFVISAGGIKQVFSSVILLANAAPHLDRWKIIAFRPRRTIANTIEFQGKIINPKDVQFSLRDNGKIAGIYLFMPNFREDDLALKQIGYLFLDEMLGEYDVETRLGLIKMVSLEAKIDGQQYPLSELPQRFDTLVARLEGRSGKPS